MYAINNDEQISKTEIYLDPATRLNQVVVTAINRTINPTSMSTMDSTTMSTPMTSTEVAMLDDEERTLSVVVVVVVTGKNLFCLLLKPLFCNININQKDPFYFFRLFSYGVEKNRLFRVFLF